MEFTGERYMPHVHGEIQLEHFHRYHLAAQLVAGKTVLDIASGEGYGAAMLAQHAAQVTGVDISDEAVAWATAHHTAANLRFVRGSVAKIPLPDMSVHVITSFETLEHVDANTQQQMLSEMQRVLVPGGLCIISTPNVATFDAEGSNHYHVHELTETEFTALLRRRYDHVALCAQKVVFGSVIDGTDKLATLQKLDGAQVQSFASAAFFFIALASNAPLPEVSGSVLEGKIEDSTPYYGIRAGLDAEAAAHRATIEKLNAAAAEVEKAAGLLAAANEQLRNAWAEKDGLTTQLTAAQYELSSVLNSRSWKITRPLRWAARVLRGGK